MNINEIVKDSLGGMLTGPKSLAKALDYQSDGALTEEALFDHLKPAPASDETCNLISRKLSAWDYESSAAWVAGTEKNTTARRQKIYELLKVTPEMSTLMSDKFPPNLQYEAPILIAGEHERWYDAARQSRRSFYRDGYSGYLRDKSGWSEDQIQNLEESTRLVTERLSDPERPEIYPVRGLVVGYVQSGKTANFTGVIARAADAGYRLIIVLAGTMDILRSQTQRRLDRELIGEPFINEEDEPIYAADLAAGRFVDHGGLPSDSGGFDWHRLTNIKGDYKRLDMGIDSLQFLKKDKFKSFNHPDNLHLDKARVMVVKKIPAVLKRVAKDLKAIDSRSLLSDIPTLIIDDESDQASVNTRKPTEKQIQERTATNKAIVEMLKQLPRAQYVGYTATPFANVFVDPNLEEDLFPRDFIISLPRPDNYTGVADFHDLDRPDKSEAGPNEKAFVRDVRGEDTEPENLQKAVDSYILTGAIKLYRESLKPELARRFRHHTMLVHISRLNDDQAVIARQVEGLLDNGGYMTGTAFGRLEKLWEKDFAPVCATRADGYDVPGSFADISPFLGECWKRLADGGKRVLVVNGEAKDNPDFEGDNIWKIVVGGAKLSRGYTIEGLTISYYRRRTEAGDTLMQMGRWFGYRGGYRDLMRLYIGREEQVKSDTVDLYEAFEGICRDEIDFRDELKKYATPTAGKPILPIQVPPLVPCHLLQPTAKNKMYNAVVEFKNFSEDWKESTLMPAENSEILKNQALLGAMLTSAGPLTSGSLSLTTAATDKRVAENINLEAQWVTISTEQMLTFLKGYNWLGGERAVLTREIEFLESSGKTGVGKWLFLCVEGPKNKPSNVFEIAGEEFRPFNRSRVSSAGRFGVFSERAHRMLARHLCGLDNATAESSVTKALRDKNQGVFVLYPTREIHNPSAPITPGFALQFPANEIELPIRFGVRVNSDAVVVDAKIGIDYGGLEEKPSFAGLPEIPGHYERDFDALVELMGLEPDVRPTFEVNEKIQIERLIKLVRTGLVTGKDLEGIVDEQDQLIDPAYLDEAAQSWEQEGKGLGQGIFDVLGSYFPADRHIVLYDAVIRIVAKKHSWPVPVLSRIVYWHEMAHAASHLGLDASKQLWAMFADATTDTLEYFAQIYAHNMLKKSTVKDGAIRTMEVMTKTQPSCYGTYLSDTGKSLPQLNADLLAKRK